MSAAGLIPWAIEALIASTVLMVAVLCLRGVVRRSFGPDIAYALWALPALRMLLPPLPQSWREIAVAPVVRASEQITVYVLEPLGGDVAAPAVQHPSLGPILVSLWVVGAAAFIGWHSFIHARFCRRMLDQTAREARIEGGVRLIETSAASGPLAFGIWRRYVAFPRDFSERYDADERNLALAHELGHHARGDLIANWIALVVLALHWFNPIAWRAFRAFRADQEIANDARVLAGQNPMLRHTYACAIVKAAHGGAVSAACHLHTINDLKGRLRMLTTNKTSRLRLFSGSAALALLTVGGLAATASGTQAAERVRSGVQTVTGVDIASLDHLALPVAAAAGAPVAAVAPAPMAPDMQAEVPPAPPAPPAGIAPPAPPAPPEALAPLPPLGPDVDSDVTTESPDGKVAHRRVVRIIHRDRDGKVTNEDFAGMPPIPEVPEVSSQNCPGDGERHQMVLNEKRHGKQVIIICTNRIERVAREGAAMAVNAKDIERNAYRSALQGLRSVREPMASNQQMKGDFRREALQAIDQSIRELEEKLAKVN